MLCNCKFWSPSFPTLHFKLQLPFPPRHSNSASYRNQTHPWLQTKSFLSWSSLRSVLLPDSTHFRDPDTVHLFCSKALKVCAKNGFLPEGKQFHSHLMKSGLCNVLSLQNQILYVYLKCKESEDAERLFEELPERNVVSWNIVNRGLVDCACNHDKYPQLSFSYFRRMMFEGVVPDDITFNGLIGACIQLNDIDMGRQFHCFTVKPGFYSDCFVGSALVDLYAKRGLVEEARRVFSCVLNRDLVLWNVIISCYVLNCLAEEAFRSFNLMRLEGINADEFTYSSLLSACDAFQYFDFGKQVHCLILRHSFASDVLVATALINMYAKNGNITDGHKVFSEIEIRNVVTWNTIIVGFGKYGEGNEVMKLLRDMLHEGCYPDELTLSSSLSSCGYVSAISETMQIHAYTIKFRFEEFLSVANALIYTYSKLGYVACAFQCFSTIVEPDLITWTSMINACAFHGLAREATEIFEKMLSRGVLPDQISFLCVLSACAHGGLVSKGLHYLKLMTDFYHIVPDSEHYACVIDILGRSGFIYEAFEFLRSLPIEPDSNTLGAFLGCCKVHANIGLANWAAEKLFTIEPKKTVNYALMSNIYASERHWSDAARVREMMEDMSDPKVPGCSWIEISNQNHSFISGDKSHPEAVEVYNTVKLLLTPMKEEILNCKGYIRACSILCALA